MTTNELAKAYQQKAQKRVRVLEVLLEQNAYSDVVREAQELVELGLKGILRAVGIDPPKWHDVGPVLLENSTLFPKWLQSDLSEMAKISKWLRKEREFSFYGDIDFIPTEEYTLDDAQKAQSGALFVLERATKLIQPEASQPK